MERIAHSLFRLICHQDPSTLLWVGGEPIPLCPRCIGLHVGFFAAMVFLILAGWRRARAGSRAWRWAALLAFGALVLDWGAGQVGLRSPTMASRLLTGAACGASLAPAALAYAFGSRTAGEASCRWGIPAALLVGLIIGIIFVRQDVHAVALATVMLSLLANAVTAIVCLARLTRTRWAGYRSTPGGVR